MPLSSADRYDRSALAVNQLSMLQMIPSGVRILELGASTGYMSAGMRANGSHVVAVEYDRDVLPALAERADEAYFGDLEDPSTTAYLDGRSFDVIVLADVLEHLVDPAGALSRCAPWVAPGGRVLICMPNVAFWRVRLDLLRGKWETTEAGIMDETHLRWFTKASAEQMFRNAGFEISAHEQVWHQMPLDPRVHLKAPRLIPVKDRINRGLQRRYPALFAGQYLWDLRLTPIA